MKLTAQELEQMKSVNIGAVSADALADVSGMAFDRTLPREHPLDDLKNDEITENREKREMHTVGPGIWREN